MVHGRGPLGRIGAKLKEIPLHSQNSRGLVMHRLLSDWLTPEERLLKTFTRNNCKKLPNWEEWRQAEFTQLDGHQAANALGTPCKIPKSTKDNPVHVFRAQWNRSVKAGDGTRKARCCLDGSPRAAPGLREMVQTYANCISQPGMRLMFAIAARDGLYVGFGDCVNAFQNAPGPTVQCFVVVDEAIADWYLDRFQKHLVPGQDCIPLKKALQGHPEAGALWERFAKRVCRSFRIV